MYTSNSKRLFYAGLAVLVFSLSYTSEAAARPLMNLSFSIPRPLPGLGSVGIYPGVLVQDVDRDGVRELLVTNVIDKQIEVYHVSEGGPQLASTIKFPEVPVAMAAGDINLDGVKELVVGTLTEGQGGYLYVGSYQNGLFSQEWRSSRIDSIRFGKEIAIGNVLGTRPREIVVGISYYGRGWAVYGATENGYSKLRSWSLGSDVESIALGEFNGHRKLEVVMGTACWTDYAIRVYEGLALKARLKTGGITKVTTFDLDQDGRREIIAGIGTQCGSGSITPAPSVAVYGYTDGNLIQKAKTGRLTSIDAINVLVAGGRIKGIPVIAAGTLNITPTDSDRHYVRLFDSNLCELWKYPLGRKEVTISVSIREVDNRGGNELIVGTNKRILAFKPRVAAWPTCQPPGATEGVTAGR